MTDTPLSATPAPSAPQASQPADRWWHNGVVYQIYPRSFCDSNGDGIGDLRGITSRLDYLQALGVQVVWLSPVYASPNDDNGYDISDYRAIHPEFGSMADFDEMLAAMHARGIRLMMDLVVNHTSDEHEWFRQARSSRDNPYHDHYIWAEPVDGREPTNWESVFSGSAWQWNEPTGEYFLHLFSKKQPDLNWENPAVRAEVFEMMRFWLDKGVDGFRMDVINLISKHWGPDGRLPDAPVVRPGFLQPGFDLVVNGPRLQEFLLEMKREALAPYDTLTVGEAPAATTAVARMITDPQHGALDMLFQFEHMDLDTLPGHPKWVFRPLPLAELKRSMARWQGDLADTGWNSLYLSNHDQPRPVSRWGDDARWRVRSATMLATFNHGMKGTPYVYQGEELGMTNFPFEHIGQCQDIETLNMYREAVDGRGEAPEDVMRAVRVKGRDNARTPMQWTAGPQAGFTTGTPWLAVNPNHGEINAEAAMADAGSVWHHYRRLIALRRSEPALVHGRFAPLLEDHAQVWGCTRTLGDQRLVVLCNFSGEDAVFSLPDDLAQAWHQRGRVLIHNAGGAPALSGAQGRLQPWEAVILAV